MYHCHVNFYLLGQQSGFLEKIKEMPPMEHFTHEYMESPEPEQSLAAKADVVFADLCNLDAKETVQQLIRAKSREGQLILLADKDQISSLEEYYTEIKDIWSFPMSEAEFQFHFLRWQQTYRMSKDFWETNSFLEATINNTPNLIWYKDKDGIHEKVNDSFCKTVNKTKQQVQGRGHAYIWDVEQDDPACIESEREVMESKKTFVSEEIIQTGAGLRTLTTYKSPLYDLDGSVMGTVGVAIDVTQERLYEQEIIQQNQMMEKVFTNIDCGVMLHTLDGKRVINTNRAALAILGYESLEELMEDGFDMIANTVMEEDQDNLRNCIQTLENEGDTVSMEYRVRHKDGDIRHIMGNVKLIKQNGELIYQRFLLDCTAQKLQEEKKEKQQQELIHALSIDYRIVCCFDLDVDKGIPLRSNAEEGIAFALNEEGNISFRESMERYIEDFVYEDERELVREAVREENLKKELADKNQHYVNYRAFVEGETKYFQLKIVRTGNWKKHSGIVLGIRCVDEETRNEMEKKTLLENALMQANRANKAKSIFLSNMSHDIRTPMNAIVGFTALAITHVNDREQVEEYLKKIMTSGNHLLSLINDVLDMSRIESGKIRLDEKACSLPDILHELRNILQADIRAKQLELYIDAVDVKNEEIICDKLRLNQVLLNLLGNAVKYTGAGGMVSLRIIEKAGAPDGYANYDFIIKDNGIGMSEEFVAHIFEPFERERTSTISGIQGTGLGMAITKNIVDMMDGTIEVKSEKDAGTEVKVSFAFSLNTEIRGPQDIPELKNCRALVVDDDFNTCDSVTYMLTQIGMRAEWTLSGKEALLRTHQAVTRGDNYTVYVIDWMLPDMNGIEVARRIRKEMGDDVPIILLTAYDWLEIEDEAKEAGVTAFCSKPLFYSELNRCLYDIVRREDEETEDTDVEVIEKRKTGRILLAEDNELNQEIAKVILEDAGFNVEVAENGNVALNMLTNSEPGYYRLILMDVRMPVMNGYEATKAIRALDDKELSSIPIFAMTANAFEEDKKEAFACGMNGHLSKPIEIDVLFETLDRVLK